MEDTKFDIDQFILNENETLNHLKDKVLPNISLPNKDGVLLKLNRNDTFRLVIFFYSLTGNPKKKLPINWDKIPGAKGCTFENLSFRDNYERLIELNAVPIGISTQTIEDIKEMSERLKINFDILSDSNLKCSNKLSLSTFSVSGKTYIRRSTIIVEKNIVKKIFYPIFSIEKHIKEIIEWLKKN